MVSRRDCANSIRALAMDAVQKANSGHPGMPMGMADIAEVLWRDYLHYNPSNPHWLNRDRFVISNGHGAMLLYALLHLTGFDLSIEDLKQFRQLHSRTPGHPEYAETPGVETTTGPLGQGLANAVGMAIAESVLAQQFNRAGFPVIDHYTYAFVGDGCLMEGISHEACSLAGTLGLGKLIVVWDDNGISIDGEVGGWFTDNTPQRFESYHWHVIPNVDGHDAEAVANAIAAAKKVVDKPSFICCKTTIGFGAPNLGGTADCHGAPLGNEEIALARKTLNWPHPPFEIPAEIYSAWDARQKGKTLEEEWNILFSKYESKYPELAAELLRRSQGWLPERFNTVSESFIAETQHKGSDIATRKASLNALTAYAAVLPELMGGSADLTGSNLTNWKGCKVLSRSEKDGNYLHYGVREFAMSAIMNGIALHRGFIPFGGTFLTFSDYARNAVRLSALMKQRVIYVYTHDSIGLGEDGPTHQPVEHAAMLRMTPGVRVWRPADDVETAVAWQQALMHQGPSCLLLTRQNVSHQKRDDAQWRDIARGGYVLLEAQGEVDGILIATGSEVSLAVLAAEKMRTQGIHVRVVSMPCCEVFKLQDETYQESVLPAKITRRLAVEAAVPDYWYQFVGANGAVIGMDRFGASAPAKEVFSAYGFSVENIIAKVTALLSLQEMMI
ncbi:MAG: transketolase [Coxiella sp. RIFCSPHIGHO2_12_FULL_44_14]|nr:MAG: transketolase [Coxiella sp. RIFCSPHIGHO2_12_FULL_44_14]